MLPVKNTIYKLFDVIKIKGKEDQTALFYKFDS